MRNHDNFPGEYPPKIPEFSRIPEEYRPEAMKLYKARRLSGPMGVQKKNVLIHLLEEDIIDSCLIIGPPATILNKAIKRPFFWDENKRTFEYYTRRKERIRFISPDDYTYHGKTDRQSYIEAVYKEFSYLKNRGVTYIPFSVDMDVLNPLLGYTAFDYNPFSYFVKLGLIDVTDYASGIWDDIVAQHNMDSRAHIVSKFLDDTLHMPLYSKDPLVAGAVGQRPMSVKRMGGVPAGLIGRSIDVMKVMARELAMEIGVPLPYGRLIGDVVELSGYDYGGRTAKIAAGLVKRLVSP